MRCYKIVVRGIFKMNKLAEDKYNGQKISVIKSNSKIASLLLVAMLSVGAVNNKEATAKTIIDINNNKTRININNYNDDILTTEEFLTAELNDSSESHTNAAYCDFSSLGYSMCITAVSGGNSRKSGDNDEMLRGMEEAAEYFGRKLICDVDEDEFYKELPKMRKNCSDTAVLSAIRFFEEERIASEEAKALEIGDTEEFFRLLNQSGRYSVSQEAAVALAVSERFLGGSGAVRVCANESIQAFVPSYIAADYTAEMNSIFGEKSCHISGVRSIFPCCIK